MAFLFMAIKTTLEQIEEVQASISKVMAGQEATIDGKRLRYADLDMLSKRESMLLERYKREQGTGGLCFNIGVLRRD